MKLLVYKSEPLSFFLRRLSNAPNDGRSIDCYLVNLSPLENVDWESGQPGNGESIVLKRVK